MSELGCPTPAPKTAQGKWPHQTDVPLRAPDERRKKIQSFAEAAAELYGSGSSSSNHARQGCEHAGKTTDDGRRSESEGANHRKATAGSNTPPRHLLPHPTSPHPRPASIGHLEDRMGVIATVAEREVDESESGSISSSDYSSQSDDDDDDDRGDMRRAACLTWMKQLKRNGNVIVDDPPLFIVLYPDLLQKGWGWKRILPYYPHYVSWSTFKGYLKDYFHQNKDEPAALCAHHKRDPVGQDLSADPLHVAASLCIKVEEELLNDCLACLTSEDIQLSHEIKDRARNMIESDGKYVTAAVGFVCITKEAELICCLSKRNNFDTTGLVAFSNSIRQSALNLLLSEEPESAAAMVGIAKEAMSMCSHLSNKQTMLEDDLYSQYLFCQNTREATAKVLTMLEDDFCFETAGDGTPSAKSEKPMGKATASELKCQRSDPKQNYMMGIDHCEKDKNLKGKKRKFKNGKRLNKNLFLLNIMKRRSPALLTKRLNKNLNNATSKELKEKQLRREKRRS